MPGLHLKQLLSVFVLLRVTFIFPDVFHMSRKFSTVMRKRIPFDAETSNILPQDVFYTSREDFGGYARKVMLCRQNRTARSSPSPSP